MLMTTSLLSGYVLYLLFSLTDILCELVIAIYVWSVIYSYIICVLQVFRSSLDNSEMPVWCC